MTAAAHTRWDYQEARQGAKMLRVADPRSSFCGRVQPERGSVNRSMWLGARPVNSRKVSSLRKVAGHRPALRELAVRRNGSLRSTKVWLASSQAPCKVPAH